MANIASAKKRARQNKVRYQLKAAQRSMLRTYIKKVGAAIAANDKQEAIAAYRALTPVIDSLANKGVLHKNKAARHKRRLNARLRAL